MTSTSRSETSSHKLRYIPSFDVLRGFAALLVLLLHGSYGFFKGGWIGVDLFFVLSGYLITSLLQKEYCNFGKIAISKFYARRALRLLPPLLICIIISNVLWSFTALYPGADQRQATLAALFYFTNFIPGNVSGNMAHLWSLSVEEHFYIFFPIIASSVLFMISFRKSLSLLIALVLSVSIFRIITYNFFFQFAGFITIDPSHFTLSRIDGILLGVILAVILSNPKFNAVKLKDKAATLYLALLFFAFVVVLFTLSEYNTNWHNGGFIITNLICAFTVLIAIKNPDHYFFSNKILRWIGIRSYGIYIYHFPIFLAFERLRQHHSVNNFLLVTLLRFIITFVIAELSFKYIEKPILKLKVRYTVNTSLITDVNQP